MSKPARKAGGYLTLRQVAEQITHEPWSEATRLRLWRAFVRRQQATGRQLLFRDHGRRTWLTTQAAVQDSFPEWFSARDEAALQLGEAHDSLVEQMRIMRLQMNAMGAKLAAHLREHREARASGGSVLDSSTATQPHVDRIKGVA